MKHHFLLRLFIAVCISYIDCYMPTFSACGYPLVGKECEMRCSVQDFSEVIELFVNGTSKGTCTVFGCGAGLSKNATTKSVTLTISTLDYTRDNGKWTCAYGGNTSNEVDFIVYGNPNKVVITNTNPVSGTNIIEKVDVTAEMECAYPSNPSVTLEFNDEMNSTNYQSIPIPAAKKMVSSSDPSSGQCTFAVETIIIAKMEASYSDTPNELSGKTGFIRVVFSYNEDVVFSTPNVGPYTFKDCRDPFLYGFLPVFLIVLVSSIICLVILKLESFEKLGGLTKEKIAFIIASNVVAIAVGLGLGFGLRSGDNKCEKWILAICLSFLFGVVISIVLYVVIVIRNSKKESKDEGVTSDKKTDTERSDGDKRARSVVSASAVKVQAERHKPTEKSTGVSSLDSKSYGSPLPKIPNDHNNPQSPNLKQEREEMESSANKPYTKSHENPLPETPQGRNNPLLPIMNADRGEGESSVPGKKKKKKKKKKREDSGENEEEN